MDLSTTHNIVLAELRVILRMKYYKAVFISKIHFPKYTIHDINWTSTIVLISFLSILLHPLYKAAMWGWSGGIMDESRVNFCRIKLPCIVSLCGFKFLD